MPAKMEPQSPWLSAPLSEVSRLFSDGMSAGKSVKCLEEEIRSTIATYVNDPAVWNSLPLVNTSPSHTWCANKLARFRGMVQDMFDPEFYLRSYGIRQTSKAGSVRTECGLFRDVAECGADERLDPELSESGDRQTLRCVTVPYQTPWVREAEQSSTLVRDELHTEVNDSMGKRKLDEDESIDMNVDSEPVSTTEDADKRLRTEPVSSEQSTSTNSNELPSAAPSSVLASSSADETLACLVKIYDDEHKLCLNDMVEFVGILSLDPTLATIPEGAEDAMDADELAAHNPPPSLVPRLHAVAWRKLSHYNPLISHMSDPEPLTPEEALSTRGHLLTVLQSVLRGDALAAELLLCHLVSAVYIRHDIMALGKFSLNISGVRADDELAPRLFALLSRLTEKAQFLPLSLARMNGCSLVPKKDYQKNLLTTAELQLSANTHLIIDETALTQGQLEERGVRNVAALGHLITWQKVEYDFGFHRLAYTADAPCLVVSEGRSLLPSDCRLPLQTRLSAEEAQRQRRAADEYLTPGLLHQIRRYLTLARLSPYTVPEDVQQLVQQQFVSWRQQPAQQQVKSDDLHQLLVLARLLSVSSGCQQLTEQLWQRACQLDDRRRQREQSGGPMPSAA